MSQEFEIVDDFDSIRKSFLENNIFSEVVNDGILIPKDSIEILNELQPGIVIETEQLKLNKNVMATVKMNDNIYLEYGKTESQAVQAVAESALKDLFFETIKSTIFNEDNCQYNTNSWRLLGSLAMFKLIEEWLKFYMSNNKYKNAFDISTSTKTKDSSNNLQSQKQKAKVSKSDCTLKEEESSLKCVKKVAVPKKKQQSPLQKFIANKILTEDVNTCTLLNLISPKTKFVDLCSNKTQPPFIISVTVDNVEYLSEASGSKKEAKQNVSKRVLIKKFGFSCK